jgi:DNA-binding MarR family transcriptional regulator
MEEVKPYKPMQIVDVHIEKTIPRVFVLFLQTAYAVDKYAEIELTRAGLSISKLMALQIIAIQGGDAMPSTIAHWMLRERHNITTLVGRLSRDGLVRVKKTTRGDRRTASVILTYKGRQALKQVRPVTKKILTQIMANMDEKDAASLEQHLKILRLNAQQGLDSTTKP